MRRILAWFRAHRIVTWSLRIIVALWVVHEWMNWSAEREWRRYCDEARARGVKLTLAEFAPPEIPDAENFAALPMFKAALAASWASAPNPFELPGPLSGSLPSGDDLIKRTSIDWTAWQQHFKNAGLIAEATSDPIADVLRAFDHYKPAIEEWRGWKQRPRCRFPLDWKADPTDMRFPPFGLLQSATQVCGWRMRAHLAQHDSGAALEDFRDAFQTYRALRDEPTLIAGLVRVAALAVVNARIGNGLAAHAWSEPDLRALDAELSVVRPWDDYRLAVSSERAFGNAMLDARAAAGPLQRSEMFARGRSLPMSKVSPGFPDFLVGFSMSKHKVRDNQIRTNRYCDEVLARVANDRIDFERATPSEPDNNGNFFHQWHYLIFSMTASRYTFIEEKYVRMQTQLHQTRLAIALERHHLARGVYPETLDALVPEFLDTLLLDPWSGKPMPYRRAKTDSFSLYSVGKDRKDDGGMIDVRKHESRQSDVIWLYAPP